MIKQLFFGIFVIITLTLIVLTLYMVAWAKLFPPLINYDCSLPLDTYSNPNPPCQVFRTENIPTSFDFSFFTTNTIAPTFTPASTPQSDPYLYYYGHPAAIFKNDADSSLFSYPFILEAGLNTNAYINLLPYSFTTIPSETINNPFKQFAYTSPNSDAENGCNMIFRGLTGRFTKNSDVGTTSGRPFLNTRLTSGDVSVLLCQGVPYIASRTYSSATTISIDVETPITFDTETITVTPTKSYTCYLIWNNISKMNCTVFIIDSSTAVAVGYVGTTFSIDITVNDPVVDTLYITMLKINGVETLNSVLTSFVRFLVPPIIQVRDVHTVGTSIYIQYTGEIIPGSFGIMWIVPNNIEGVGGLRELGHTMTSFGFPTGKGIFLTFMTDGLVSSSISFYTVWKQVDIPSDFDYVLPYKNEDGSNLSSSRNEGEVVINTYNDMYELSISLRVMHDTNIHLNMEFLISCITFWKTELNKLLYDGTYKTAYFNDLGTEMGYISKFCYILLTYINLFSVCASGLIPTASSPYQIVMNDDTLKQIKTIIETTLVTTDTYIGLQYFDFYNSTIPNIRDGIIYYSRLGEVISFIWACNFVIRNIFLQPGSLAAELSGALFSIICSGNMALLRGKCSWIEVSPYLPWNGLYANNRIGFQQDFNAMTYMGKSPDSVYLESLIPFSPPSHKIIRPIMIELDLEVSKNLRCPITVNGMQTRIYNGYIDPYWVYFTLYAFEDADYWSLFLETSSEFPGNDFVNEVKTKYPLVALLMNLRKLSK